MKQIRTRAASAAIAVLLAGAAPLAVSAQDQTFNTEHVGVAAETVASGLEHPWGLAFLPDGAMLVTERAGRMRIVENGQLSDALEGVPEVFAQRQGGLLDVVLDPDFETSNRVFFSFSEPGEGGAGTAVARATLVREGNGGRLDDVEVIFSMARKTPAGQHFGSRLVFSDDGTLFVTTGDRGDGPRSQDMQDHAGAILRINQDGSIPDDNPSADGREHLPEIWAKGMRNPQGAVLDPVTGQYWVVEHGPAGGDNIHQPQAGLNYGWPEISHGRHYSGGRVGVGPEAPGMEQPVYFWTPSIAPSGMAVYQGDMFAEWEGDFLIGGLRSQMLVRLARDDTGEILDEERMFEGAFGRIRDVRVADDGSVYLLTDEANGAIVRLTRAD